jgi:hypothetical protein
LRTALSQTNTIFHTGASSGPDSRHCKPLRPPLLDDIYANVTRYLEEGRERPADGMADLDKFGCGVLCRAAFLVQAKRILKNCRQLLLPQ